MIEATFPAGAITATSGVSGARTISGVAVPYGVTGRVASGDVVVFEPGSIDAGARPVALRDHDRTRPIGRVIDAVDHGNHLAATVRVSSVPDGDIALVLAADGALEAFSVGVDPTDYAYDADGTLRVRAGTWLELSLLTIGAYDTARVHTVTATRGDPMLTATDDPTTTPDPQPAPPPPPPPPPPPDDDDDDDDDDDGGKDFVTGGVTAAGAVAVPLAAAAGRHPSAAGRHPFAAVGIREVARMLMDARFDDRVARQTNRVLAAGAIGNTIEAALADVKMVGTDNIGAAVRPGYQAELLDIISWGSPAVESISQGDLQRGDYPNKTFNQWTKTPKVALQATEKTDINSVPVSIGPVSVPVKTWATGNDISQQVMDFGSPSFVEDYIRAAGADYATVIDVYAVTAMLAAATSVVTVATDTLTTIIGKLFAALDPTKVPAGAMFMLCSWDIGIGAMGAVNADRPAFWDGSINFGTSRPTTTMGGLSVTVDPNMPAKTALLGLRNAAMWYDLPGAPFTLRAINVGQLGFDIAVYGYGALGVKFPGALVKTTKP